MHRSSRALLLALACLTGQACQSPRPDYARPLAPGERGLRLLTPSEWPDVKPAFRERPGDLTAAMSRSLAWFDRPSSARHFPDATTGVTHAQARASVEAFWRLASSCRSAAEFEARLREGFDAWESVGWDRRGTVLFTAYCSPTFDASPVATPQFRYPLYRRPPGLVTDEDGRVSRPFPARAQIERDPAAVGLAGLELAWLRDRFEVYVVHVQGSARLRMPDGELRHVGYAGTNGHEYQSVSQELIRDGLLQPEQLGVPAMTRLFRERPELLDRYLAVNPRYVFFQDYQPGSWPQGSLGVPVTAFRSVATDKAVFPRGGVVMVDTTLPAAGSTRSFTHFMLDQDTGGAIRAPGRADLYLGEDTSACDLAGRQHAEGRLYYFFLKPGSPAPVSPVSPSPSPSPSASPPAS